MKMPIDKALDAMHTQRWSLVHTNCRSTVADHSFSVAVIAMAIRKKMFNTNHFSEKDVCYFAILHDLREVLTGDVPTPVKMAMRASGFDPESLYPEIPHEERPPDNIERLIKLADLISNYVFIYEHGVGARARLAISEVRGRLEDAIDGASEDMGTAARWVLEFIVNRKSETDGEERRKAAEDGERLRSTNAFVRSFYPLIVDRES